MAFSLLQFSIDTTTTSDDTTSERFTEGWHTALYNHCLFQFSWDSMRRNDVLEILRYLLHRQFAYSSQLLF